MKENVKKLAESMGLRMFVPDTGISPLTYAYLTDGKRIAYVQWSDYRTNTCSVHMSSSENGTGFHIQDDISEQSILDALNCIRPNWANGTVRKWKDWEQFHNSSAFNRELVEV